MAALLRFVLKHHVSAGETSAVCFEGVSALVGPSRGVLLVLGPCASAGVSAVLERNLAAPRFAGADTA